MSRPVRRLITDDESLNSAEEELRMAYPASIRLLLKKENGFERNGFHFFCVYDSQDKFNTYEDVVRQNKQLKLPEGFKAIAADDQGNYVAIKRGDARMYRVNTTTVTEEFSL